MTLSNNMKIILAYCLAIWNFFLQAVPLKENLEVVLVIASIVLTFVTTLKFLWDLFDKVKRKTKSK